MKHNMHKANILVIATMSHWCYLGVDYLGCGGYVLHMGFTIVIYKVLSKPLRTGDCCYFLRLSAARVWTLDTVTK